MSCGSCQPPHRYTSISQHQPPSGAKFYTSSVSIYFITDPQCIYTPLGQSQCVIPLPISGREARHIPPACPLVVARTMASRERVLDIVFSRAACVEFRRRLETADDCDFGVVLARGGGEGAGGDGAEEGAHGCHFKVDLLEDG